MTIRGLQGPILATVMQHDAPPEDRASVLSIATLMFRLSFVVAGPPIGALVDRAGMETALGVLSVGLGAVSLLAFRALSAAPFPSTPATVLSAFFTERPAAILRRSTRHRP